MANYTGVKGNKGGKMARKSSIYIDYSALESYLDRLKAVEADVNQVVADAMEKIGAEVQEETKQALEDANLPAKGKYSKGNTLRSVISDPKAEKGRNIIEISLGFDKTKPGAGGFLITGTPKMQPDKKLQAIYGSKGKEKRLNQQLQEELEKAIHERMGN